MLYMAVRDQSKRPPRTPRSAQGSGGTTWADLPRAATDREWSRGLSRGDDWLSPRGLSRVLKTLREQRELTQVQLAKKVRVTQPYISKLEAGDKANPSLDVLKRLARALGVPVTDLLE
jgi:DNA-binding XRE family transcriptional regulator